MFVMGTVWWFLLDAIAVDSLLIFLVLAVIYSVMYFLLAYRFMMNAYERNLILAPMVSVLRKLHLIRKREE